MTPSNQGVEETAIANPEAPSSVPVETPNAAATVPLTLVEPLKTVEQTMAALNDAIRGIAGQMKTQAEKMEAVEKQLADAQQINEDKKLSSPMGKIPILGGVESVESDLIFKEINDHTPPEVAKAVINKAIGSPSDDQRIIELQEWSDKIKILCGNTNKMPFQLKCWPEYEKWLTKTGLGKAMSVADSPANWIPEGWSAELLTFYQQELMIASLFEMMEMPTDPFRWDFLGTGFTIYIRDEPITDPASRIRASDHSQDVITFTTSELAGRIVLSRKLTEDALAAYVPTLRTNLIPRAMAEAMEKALLSGDNSATHFDTAVTATDDVRKAWIGLRKIADRESATYDVQTGASAFAYSDFGQVLLQAGKFGIRVNEGAWVMANAAYIQTLSMDEVETMDKFNLPTNANGVVNIVYGRPVIVSGEYPQTLNSANGRDTGSGSTNGFVYVNRRQFMIGFRREDDIEQDRDIQTGQDIMVVTTRKDFQQMLPTGNTTVAAGFNVPN